MSNQLSNDPQAQIVQLQNRIFQLENQVRALRRSGSGVSNLESPSFMKRAFAVWGHHFVAQLIITIILGILGACISVILGGSIIGAITSLLNY